MRSVSSRRCSWSWRSAAGFGCLLRILPADTGASTSSTSIMRSLPVALGFLLVGEAAGLPRLDRDPGTLSKRRWPLVNCFCAIWPGRDRSRRLRTRGSMSIAAGTLSPASVHASMRMSFASRGSVAWRAHRSSAVLGGHGGHGHRRSRGDDGSTMRMTTHRAIPDSQTKTPRGHEARGATSSTEFFRLEEELHADARG